MPSNNRKENTYCCHHIALFVANLDKVSRFYVSKLGFKSCRDFVVDRNTIRSIFRINSQAQMRLLERDNFNVELIYFPNSKLSKRNNKTAGYNHWTMLVKNKKHFCSTLKKKKVPVIKVARPGGHVFFIQDPEGNLIEIKDK